MHSVSTSRHAIPHPRPENNPIGVRILSLIALVPALHLLWHYDAMSQRSEVCSESWPTLHAIFTLMTFCMHPFFRSNPNSFDGTRMWSYSTFTKGSIRRCRHPQAQSQLPHGRFALRVSSVLSIHTHIQPHMLFKTSIKTPGRCLFGPAIGRWFSHVLNVVYVTVLCALPCC